MWIKYNSRSGTHNMYREYRDVTLNGAIDTLYNDMAGRHRARARSIQIIRTATVANEDCKRVNVMQFHDQDLKFPLPHRQLRTPKSLKKVFSCIKPQTHFQ